MAFAALARRIGQSGLDLLLPPGCMACEAPVSGGHQLCGSCFGRCHFITAPLCAACGVPFGHVGQGVRGRCRACAERRPPFGAARAALVYDAHSRGLLLAFKHGERTELARLFAPMLARAGAGLLDGADWLVPVPLHPSRLRQRGFNQAALLARALGRLCGVAPLVDGLERVRRTPPLGEHDAASRAALMRGAVRTRARREAAVLGRRIVLVDDVMTSGATAGACAEALRAAGAAQVDVLAVARVPAPDSGDDLNGAAAGGRG